MFWVIDLCWKESVLWCRMKTASGIVPVPDVLCERNKGFNDDAKIDQKPIECISRNPLG